MPTPWRVRATRDVFLRCAMFRGLAPALAA